MELKREHGIISGRVQGVCYRYFACQAARDLGLTGWVRNRVDGSVEYEAQATEDLLVEFRRALHQGPPLARVSGIQVQERAPTTSETGFQIRY